MRFMGTGLAMVVALGVSGCQPQDSAPAASTATSAPPEAMAATFPTCDWGEVTGSGLSVWSYDCGPDRGDVRLVGDDGLPGFALEMTMDGQTSRRPAIIVFRKAAGDPVESIVEAVRARSPGPGAATCTLQPVTFDGVIPGSFAFRPTGEVRTRWEAFESGATDAEPMEPPCGDLGPQMAGFGGFHGLEGDPTTVVFVDYGSEIQIFDPSTIRPAG